MDTYRRATETPGAKFGGLLTALVRLVRFLWANWEVAQNYGIQPAWSWTMSWKHAFHFLNLFSVFILPPKFNASSKWNVFSFTWLSWKADIHQG